MKRLRKYHATGKISYRKGVLYEIDRRTEGEVNLKNKKESESVVSKIKTAAQSCFKKVAEFFGGAADLLRRKLGINTSKRYQRNKRVHPVTREDKLFYILTAGVCAAVVVITAVITTVALSHDTVTINDEGRISYATVKDGLTVSELLTQNDIVINEGDAVEVSDAQTLSNGMQIVIHRALPVTVYVDGKSVTVSMLAGTVEDVLNAAGVTLGEADEVYPSLNTYVTNSMTINIVRVNVEYITETSAIEYKEIKKQSDKYPKGTTVLAQAGVNGTLQKSITVTYKDGVEYSRTVTDTKVIKEAQDEIIYVGTYVAPTPTKKPQTSSGGSSSGGSSGGSGITPGGDYGQNIPTIDGLLTQIPTISQIHSGSMAEHKSVAAPAANLIKMTVTAKTTSYCLTSKTATGTYPRIGTVGADPKVLPYGTIVYVPGYGYGRVEDTGYGFSDTGYWLDLWLPTVNDCRIWGRKYLKVYVLG